MMIVMKSDARAHEIEAVVERVEEAGARAHISRGDEITVIGAIGNRERIARLYLESLAGVDRVVPISKPYKLASSELRRGIPSMFDIGGRLVGDQHFTLIAGPCTVESRGQALSAAHAVKAAGCTMFRGGAYKPRSSPYAFRGLGEEGLRLLAEVKQATCLPIVTEVLDARDLDLVAGVADVVQIGARNMQNYTLLTEVGRSGIPVLLKRGLAATLEELLMSAEYILTEGNDAVMLCERGIRTFEGAYRFTLDITAVPALKQMTHLPVIVDPSHAAGRRELVTPLSLAAAAAGADGIIVETHPAPDEAVCDGPQAIPTSALGEYAALLRCATAVAAQARAATPLSPLPAAAVVAA